MTIEFPELPPIHEAEELAAEHYDLVEEAAKYWDKLDFRLQDIISRYAEAPALTVRQAQWLENEMAKYRQAEPLYGDFKAIKVMFRIAGNHLQRPKIRLLTAEGVFLQLTFIPGQDIILLHRDGWQGHGKRQHIGWIEEGQIKPKFANALNNDIKNMIQGFSLDPQAVAKACALKLGACSFCGSRLTDPESKARGYGPICADHFALPWGQMTEEVRKRQAKIAGLEDLGQLFT